VRWLAALIYRAHEILIAQQKENGEHGILELLCVPRVELGRSWGAPLRAGQVDEGELALGDVLGLQVGGLDDHGHDQVGAR
jgi:hypothetical protein